MQKYCVVPQRDNRFLVLVKGMELTQEESVLLRHCFIKHVEVSPNTRTWEIVLATRQSIDEALLASAAVYIRESCGLREVIFYQEVIDIEAVITKGWVSLVKRVSEDAPAIRPFLLHAKRNYSDDCLYVCVGSAIAGPILESHDAADRLRRGLKELTGCSCEVICETYEDDALDASVDAVQEIVQTAAYREALKQEQQRESLPAPAPVASENEWGGRRRRAGKKVTAPGCIYGSVEGSAIPIASIEKKTKNVLVVGTIEGIKDQDLKEKSLLSFEIADEAQGICVKIFFRDKKEIEHVYGAIKQGMRVRVKGSVDFDNYDKDWVLYATGIKEEPMALREDKAEIKRVELHAHTQMSAMDSVVSTENLIRTAARWGWDAVAITDHGVVQAFPDAMNVLEKDKLDIKVIYGMEGYLTDDNYEESHANHIIILAKNLEGLHNLYRLVSLSHLRFFYYQPRIPKRLLREYREGLILGSACEAGELVRAIVAGKSEEELCEIAAFYDYLEIQPIGNNAFFLRSDKFPNLRTDDDLRDINRKVAELAKKLGKPLIATCDVHFLNPEDSIYRMIIQAGKKFDDAELQPPLYLRTTEEMLGEFDYLGEDTAYEAVVTNPRRIAEMVERFKPIPDGLYSPMIPGADEEIRRMSYDRAHALYGENLPEVVQARLDQELTPIIGHGFSVLYLIAQKLVKKSNMDGYLVGSRGSVGSSFVATMTDITEVNPLPPHWRCPKCQYSRFVQDGSYSSGFDLPDEDCPICGTPLLKDGHDIPFAVFLGFDGDKVPDIDLNFSGVYQPTAHKYTEQLFGRDNVYRAGEIMKVKDRTAYGYVRKYYDGKGENKREAFVQHLVNGCVGTKQTASQHPAGIMVVPRNMDIHFFTPIQHPSGNADKDKNTITTHFDYHSISSRLVKLDILGHDDPTVIKMLEELTHRDPKTIPFDDKATLSLFYSTEALGVSPEELGASSGTFGIPEFRTPFTRQMIDDTHPSCFSDLVRISGFSHGTDVWVNNAQDLIRAGTCTLHDAISARDDIMMYLIHKGIEPLLAFKTMESVRKGKGIKQDVVEKLRAGGVPDWYIGACQKIKYLFPRAHATAYVMMAYRIAYCKVHYPLAFYAAYFSIRADAFDANIVAKGKEIVKREIRELEKIEKLDDKQNKLLIVLQIAWEMYLRGYAVEPVDLYRSDAEKFIICERSLLPPFTSLKGFGSVAARALVEARKGGKFSSISDIKKRASAVSKTNIELLREHGCLAGMSESDQMDLFA